MSKRTIREYWDFILKEGFHTPPLIGDRRNKVALPDYFDPEQFKRGHDFIKENIFAIFVGNVPGIITMLTLKCFLDDIKVTNRSIFSTDSLEMHLKMMNYVFEIYEEPQDGFVTQKLSAFHKLKEFFATSPGGLYATQRDLALCQFAFCGYILRRPRLLGIDSEINSSNLVAFNHFWRVLGHCLGLEERFNLCSSSCSETIERIHGMTPRIIGPAFVQHSHTYQRIIEDFVDIFWYFNPLVTTESIKFLSNRLAGVPGHYLTEEERLKDLNSLEDHRGYLGQFFYKLKGQCELNTPKCFTYQQLIPWTDKLVIVAVMSVLSKYLSSKYHRWFWNSLIWLGRFCVRQLSFMAVGMGFKCSYVKFWTMRKTVQMKLNQSQRRKSGNSLEGDPKDELNLIES